MKQNVSGSLLRLFFALWPNARERSDLAAWQLPLCECCGGRLMRTDTLHVTLVFLGEVAEQRLEALCLAAQEVEFQSFALNLALAHYWGHNHIVYAAPAATPPQLAGLVSDLEQRLRKHRFHFEPRPYKLHVTLLRNAHWTDAVLPHMPAVQWQCNDFALVQSLREEGGEHYRVLARFAASKLE